MVAAGETSSNLPAEIWECIFNYFNGDNSTLNSLSVVCKQFLSITDDLRFSPLTITDQTVPFLHPRLFRRFPTLTSLNLILSFEIDYFNAFLTQISTFPNLSNIKSLCLSNPNTDFPSNGLRALSEKITNLTSLTCSRMFYIHKNDLFFIANRFPLLEELDLGYVLHDDDDGDQLLPLPKLRKIKFSGSYYCHSIKYLCSKNIVLIQEVIVKEWISGRKRRITFR